MILFINKKQEEYIRKSIIEFTETTKGIYADNKEIKKILKIFNINIKKGGK